MAVHRNQAGAMTGITDRQFQFDVIRGLSSTPKYLPSKYFYDENGDRLFRRIMKLPEYYLTKCEEEIFRSQTRLMVIPVLNRFSEFDIIELGPGDATKSGYLLKYLSESKISFTYYPIDISSSVIAMLQEELPRRIPGMEVQGLQGDYFHMLRHVCQMSDRRKLILFLGAGIGNYTRQEARLFLEEMRRNLLPGDLLLTGFDLKKSPRLILAAYDDRDGVTRDFNLNLLSRINRELGADIRVDLFEHYPIYDPVSGSCRSYLVSRDDQEAQIGDERIRFYRYEPVFTEISQKYSETETIELALDCGFRPVQHFHDKKEWFLDALWERV